MTSREELDQKVREAEAALLEAKRERSRFEQLTPDVKLAENLHSLLCTSEHTEACWWYYEVDKFNVNTWNRSTHSRYLKNAKAVIKVIEDAYARPIEPRDIENVIKIIKAARGY